MSKAIEELTHEISLLNERLAGLSTGQNLYTHAMAKDLTKHELFTLTTFLAILSNTNFKIDLFRIDEIIGLSLDISNKLKDKLEI